MAASVIVLGAVLVPVGAAGASTLSPPARMAACDGNVLPARWEGPSTATVEYGATWSFVAYSNAAYQTIGPWSGVGAVSGGAAYAPSSYPYWDGANCQLYLTVASSAEARPLVPGTYTVSADISNRAGDYHDIPDPAASLTVTPAALTVTLQAAADPSNASNVIISGELTGAFRQNFYSTSFPASPLTPAGTWKIEVTDDTGETVHEATYQRAETDDNMGFSSYWTDVPAGSYTVRGTFTATGSSVQNFTVTNPSPVTYSASPAPGATSTATPAPPAPPPAETDAGLTLPAWVPVAAGVLSAALIALLVVQIVRLRRAGAPVLSEGSGA